MILAEAQAFINEVVEQRRRWGSRLSIEDFSSDDLLSALVVVADHEEAKEAASKGKQSAEVTKLNRQLGASLARETKLKQDLANLKLSIGETPTNE